MKILHKMIFGLGGIISLIIIVGIFSLLQINRITDLATEDIPKLVEESTNLILVAVFISLVIATGFGLFTARSITKPLSNLRTAANKMAGGKLDVKIEINSDDEFGELGRTYNDMSTSLKGVINLLSHTEQRYRSLYEDSPELYRTINTEGIILDCNTSYVNSLGYTKEEIIGSSIFDHVAEGSASDLKTSFESWRNEGHLTSREIWFKKKDGSIFPTLLSASNLYDENGKLIGSNTVIRNMTEVYNVRKELEEQKLKRLSAIGELSARIAHDLRNPLGVIKNTIEIIKIKNPTMDEKSKNDLSRLDRAVTRMTHQIDEVLDYVTPKPLNFSSNSLMKIIHLALERMVKPDTVQIILPQRDVTLTCDSEKIEIVFANLITNAIQAMNNKGEINIRINDENDYAIIEVEDNGSGISDENMLKIFDPLFTTKQTGTGLGLVSCKSVIENHGGTIHAKSELGKGTTFIIKLPKQQK
ncbi:MAG TPA: ATP-binding protein [Nitrosarchaeum sp.]|nr:ATP-binding protein [Nitrosarchaeum sp.]